MNAAFSFEWPLAWQLGLPLALLVALFTYARLRQGGVPRPRRATLAVLRGLLLAGLSLLAAKPTRTLEAPPVPASQSVVVLVDRSESMSLNENGSTRYRQALDFLRGRLLPALREADLPAQALLFAQEAEIADGARLATAQPDGKRTNLGRAVNRGLALSPQAPLAVLALTDGAVNESGENARALAALVEHRVPFVGVGVGSDLGARTLALRYVDAPPVVAPSNSFQVAAQLEMINSEDLPAFDLVLFRNGQMVEKKTLRAGHGSRSWRESFRVSEAQQGVYQYSVQFQPPNVPGLKCVNAHGSAFVKVIEEREVRVLYVQGALTWDYKFIQLALQKDPSIRLTGLTRTAKESVYRQNIENPNELLQGFPTSLEEIAPFRVVVLSNLKPIDLTPAQQELLGRFCGELGGGLLLLGGAATFNAAWQGSRLEQLLPVVFSSQPALFVPERPFRLQLAEPAFQHAVFQLSETRPAREVWNGLPTFSQYGQVDSAKPGAEVWAVHPSDRGLKGQRILLAAQPYGAGRSAVICVQNFWRWRLAKDAEPDLFDRFWRQMFRYLSDTSRPEVTIHLADQDLRPQMDVQVVLENRPSAKNLNQKNHRFRVRVETAAAQPITEQALDLPPGQPVGFKFRADKPGPYTVKVTDERQLPVATRTVEINDLNVEFQNTARNLEALRQWASLSHGLAVKAEDCVEAGTLVQQIKTRVEKLRRHTPVQEPLGVNGWVLAALLGCLATEWWLRKQWNLR